MRTSRGISRRDYVTRCQCDWRPMQQVLEAFRDKGWAEQTEDRWHFTVPGFLISNTLIGGLLEAQAQQKMNAFPWLGEELPEDEEL